MEKDDMVWNDMVWNASEVRRQEDDNRSKVRSENKHMQQQFSLVYSYTHTYAYTYIASSC